MGTLTDKANYAKAAKDSIYSAVQDAGVDCTGVELADMPDIIEYVMTTTAEERAAISAAVSSEDNKALVSYLNSLDKSLKVVYSAGSEVNLTALANLGSGKSSSITKLVLPFAKTSFNMGKSGEKTSYDHLSISLPASSITSISLMSAEKVEVLYSPTVKTVTMSACTYLGSNGFKSCTSLETVYMPNCKTVEAGAFNGCTSLKKVVVGGSCDVYDVYYGYDLVKGKNILLMYSDKTSTSSVRIGVDGPFTLSTDAVYWITGDGEHISLKSAYEYAGCVFKGRGWARISGKPGYTFSAHVAVGWGDDSWCNRFWAWSPMTIHDDMSEMWSTFNFDVAGFEYELVSGTWYSTKTSAEIETGMEPEPSHLADKLKYLTDARDAIYDLLEDYGFEMDDIPFGEVGDLLNYIFGTTAEQRAAIDAALTSGEAGAVAEYLETSGLGISTIYSTAATCHQSALVNLEDSGVSIKTIILPDLTNTYMSETADDGVNMYFGETEVEEVVIPKATKIQVIECSTLVSIEAKTCTEIGELAFHYDPHINSVYAPECESLDSTAFVWFDKGCNIEKLVVSRNCSIGRNDKAEIPEMATPNATIEYIDD